MPTTTAAAAAPASPATATTTLASSSSSAPRIQGHLIVHVLRAHMLHNGQVFVEDENHARPFLTITFNNGTVATRPFVAHAEEASFDEHFLLQVDHPGNAIVSIRANVVLDGKPTCPCMFNVEIGTLIGYVGPQWVQFRSNGSFEKGIAGVTDGEVMISCKWYPYRTDVPSELLSKLSGALLLNKSDIKRYGALMSSSFSNAFRVDTTTEGGGGGGATSTSSSTLSSSSSSLKKPNNKSTTTLPTYEQVVEAMAQHILETGGGSLTSDMITGDPICPDMRYLHLRIPPTPFVFTSPPYGRILHDTASFDDRNFLGHFAGISHVHEVMVWGDDTIEAIQVIYTVAGARVPAPRHGKRGPSVSILTLANDEFITGIAGRRNHRGITGLTIATTQQSRSFGCPPSFEMGEDFACSLPEGSRVVSFHGGFDQTTINNLGVCYQRVASLEVPTSIS